MNYRPFEPSGNADFLNWAKQVHRASFGSRRMLTTPDSLTTQTQAGVFHRPKPISESVEEQLPEDPGDPTETQFFYFSLTYTLLNPGWTYDVRSGSWSLDITASPSNMVNCAESDDADSVPTSSGSFMAYQKRALVKLSRVVPDHWTCIAGTGLSPYPAENMTQAERDQWQNNIPFFRITPLASTYADVALGGEVLRTPPYNPLGRSPTMFSRLLGVSKQYVYPKCYDLHVGATLPNVVKNSLLPEMHMEMSVYCFSPTLLSSDADGDGVLDES